MTTEIRDGMANDWEVEIPMDDGEIMRADVYRPVQAGSYPSLVGYGPYGKGLAFQDGYPDQWTRMVDQHPDVAAGSTNAYQNWEVVDPEKWVPHGYVCVRIDSRGTGMSPGFVDHFSPRETRDLYESIEWAAAQDWSNGKVGLSGISYLAINQWHVASLQPPHLAAMCPWEGAADWYRDMTHHGGIVSTFWANWYDMQVKTVQYGLGDNGPKSRVTGRNVCGYETLTPEELAANRCDLGPTILSHPIDDEYHHDRSPVFEQIVTPVLTAGNWGGHGLHLRGNVEGFVRSASEHKWLELHGLEHWTHYYTDYGRNLQLEFFDHFLKGEDNGWDRRPPVIMQVRHLGHFEERAEDAWPIPRTQWTELYLQPDLTLADTPASADTELSFEALGDGLTFSSSPLDEETEFTGPVASTLWISSDTVDADLFLILRVFDPDGEEVTFQGALDPHSPIAHGWLRASHRKLDPTLSTPYRPYHTHDQEQRLEPGEVYRLEVELWPTSIVVPAGYTVALTVRGKDYEYEGTMDDSSEIASFKNRFTGVGPFIHDDPVDRPEAIFGGTTTLHLGPDRPGQVLVPVIP